MCRGRTAAPPAAPNPPFFGGSTKVYLCSLRIPSYAELMSRAFVVALFLLVAGSIAMLIKWEYKRFKRGQPSVSKAFKRHLEERRSEEPGRAYVPPPEGVQRAFQQGSGRR